MAQIDNQEALPGAPVAIRRGHKLQRGGAGESPVRLEPAQTTPLKKGTVVIAKVPGFRVQRATVVGLCKPVRLDWQYDLRFDDNCIVHNVPADQVEVVRS